MLRSMTVFLKPASFISPSLVLHIRHMMATPVIRTYIALILTYALATVCLSLRLASRKVKQHGYWLDDYFAVASWVSFYNPIEAHISA